MTLRLSTGLINYILDSGLGGAFDSDGRINVYSGSQPASADGDVTGTLLATLSMAADGIAAAASRAAAWNSITSDTNVDATNTAGWFRIYKAADGAGTVSTTYRRIDGAIGEITGGEINFDETAFVATGTAAISALSMSCTGWGPT